MKEFYSLHKRRPLEIAFLAYNAIQQLKHGDIENSCKPELQLLNGNAKTIAESVNISGIGIHSGKSVDIQLCLQI